MKRLVASLYLLDPVACWAGSRPLLRPGYDLVEMAASLRSDLDSRGFRRDGATLTQQLVRSLFLTSDRTVAQALREILYAVELESLGRPAPVRAAGGSGRAGPPGCRGQHLA